MDVEDIARIVEDVLEFRDYRHPRASKSYKIVRSILKTIEAAVLRGEDVKIAGFGIFRIIERPARKHPVCYFYGLKRLNNHLIESHAARRYVVFQPSKALKRFVNDNYDN